MRMPILLLLLLSFISLAYVYLQPHIILSPSVLPKQPLFVKKLSLDDVKSIPTNQIYSPSEAPEMAVTRSSFGPSPVPALSPMYHGFAAGHGKALSKHHLKHHRRKPRAVPPSSFSPSGGQGCDQITCSDPFTSTPIDSPCGCVFPMQVQLDFGVALYAVFPQVAELEIEIAAGTYLKQSQVRIMGASADSQDQGKTIVNIDLVPLGEKFDKTTALLTYERFWQKKVPINMTLFGNYEVMYVHYPGLPSSPEYVLPGIGPSRSHEHPFMANVINKDQKMNARTIVIVVLSSFVLLLVCIGAITILLKFKIPRRPSTVGPSITSFNTKRSAGIRSILSSSIASSLSASLTSNLDSNRLSVKTFSLAEIQRATEKFSSKNFLGEGGFGRVYHGTLEDGSEVAVKLLRREDQNGDREFIAEVEMLSRLHHRNLVKLIGICIDERTRCLVYELVRNGSVESHLHGVDQRKCPLDWDARMKIALGAARGLAYLHEDSNPRVIHRDFKASNILLEDDFTPKVADFGLAREATEGSQHISTRVMGTFGYVAPEYAMTGHLLVKSDVYSYGVVLLELLSGRKPVDMSQPEGQENLVTWARPFLTSREGLQQLVDPTLGGNYSFDNMARVAAIASMCVHPEVTQRPFMGEVVQALKLIYNDMDESCEYSSSQKELSSGPDIDIKADLGPECNWWSRVTPHLAHRYASSFITMDYSSGPLDEIDRPASTSTLIGGGGYITGLNRSGPLRTMRDKLAFYRLKGSMSDHGLLGRRTSLDGSMV